MELIPHAAESETFSRNANGVRAIYVLPAFSPTPLALGLNVKGLIHGRARYKTCVTMVEPSRWLLANWRYVFAKKKDD